MSKYARILSEFHGRAWSISEDLLLRMHDLLCLQASGAKWSDEEIVHRIADSNATSGYEASEHLAFRYAPNPRASERGSNRDAGKIALIPVVGIISHRMNMIDSISGPGGTSIQKLTAQFRQALEDSDCKAIVLDVDSPGGTVDGVPELASEIYEARKRKPVIAVCNSMACSAAYWLASSAGEVLITPSGQCGSIGVYMLHQDESEALKKSGIKVTIVKAGKYKAEGNSTEPLSDEALAAVQDKVNQVYSMFVKSVAGNRGTSQTAVREGYGQGRSLLAKDAVKSGLADRVGSLDDVLAELLGVRRQAFGGPTRYVSEGLSSDFSSHPSIQRRRRELALMGMTAAARPSDGSASSRMRQRQIDLMRMGSPGGPSRDSKRRRRQLELDRD